MKQILQTNTLKHLTLSLLLMFLTIGAHKAVAQNYCPNGFPATFLVEQNPDNPDECAIIIKFESTEIPEITCGTPGRPAAGTGLRGSLFWVIIGETETTNLTTLYRSGQNCRDGIYDLYYHPTIPNAYISGYSADYCVYATYPTLYINLNRSGGSNAECYLQNENPLPVEWVSVNGKLNGNRSITIDWVVASQLNNEYFEVQHSTDGVRFRTIEVQQGEGTTANQKSYSFTHLSPKYGKNFYRVRQVDFDSKFDYSETVSVNLDKKKVGLVFPNVVKENKVALELDTEKEKTFQIKIYNLQGVLIMEELVIAERGVTLHPIELPSTLPAGAYFLNLYAQDKKLETHKIMKMAE